MLNICDRVLMLSVLKKLEYILKKLIKINNFFIYYNEQQRHGIFMYKLSKTGCDFI